MHRPTTDPRRRCALLVVAFALVVAACSGGGGAKRAEEEGATGFSDAGDVSVYDLQVGDCLDIAPEVEDQVETVQGVPCEEPHRHEVYSVVDDQLDEFDVYPGAPDLEAKASQHCFRIFESYVGTAVASSALTFTYLYPTLLSWNRSDEPDRTIACVAVASEPIVEPVRNSGR